MPLCYCCSEKEFALCCEPFLLKIKNPDTPEQLMRSRYSAYVLQNAEYLLFTTHSSERKFYSKSEILNWSKNNTWMKLEIIQALDTIVEFKAYYLDEKMVPQIHHEKSTFSKENGNWRYVDGQFF